MQPSTVGSRRLPRSGCLVQSALAVFAAIDAARLWGRDDLIDGGILDYKTAPPHRPPDLLRRPMSNRIQLHRE